MSDVLMILCFSQEGEISFLFSYYNFARSYFSTSITIRINLSKYNEIYFIIFNPLFLPENFWSATDYRYILINRLPWCASRRLASCTYYYTAYLVMHNDMFSRRHRVEENTIFKRYYPRKPGPRTAIVIVYDRERVDWKDRNKKNQNSPERWKSCRRQSL